MEHLHKEHPKRLHGGPNPFTPMVLLGRRRGKDILSRKKLSQEWHSLEQIALENLMEMCHPWHRRPPF